MGYNSLSGELSDLTYLQHYVSFTLIQQYIMNNIFCFDKFELRVFFSFTGFNFLLCSCIFQHVGFSHSM